MDFHGEKRSNATHRSTTDPEAFLFKKAKGKEAKLGFLPHGLMENRNGMPVEVIMPRGTGTAEREVVPELPRGAKERHFHPKTPGGDKNYDTRGCVEAMRGEGVTPHVARNTKRKGGSAIDGRTTRHAGYAVSRRIRKRVEEIFGWMKTVGGFRKTRYRGVERTGLCGYPVGTSYNPVQMGRLLAQRQDGSMSLGGGQVGRSLPEASRNGRNRPGMGRSGGRRGLPGPLKHGRCATNEAREPMGATDAPTFQQPAK